MEGGKQKVAKGELKRWERMSEDKQGENEVRGSQRESKDQKEGCAAVRKRHIGEEVGMKRERASGARKDKKKGEKKGKMRVGGRTECKTKTRVE